MLRINPVTYSHEARCEGELTELYALDANNNPIPGAYDKYKDYKSDSHIRRYIKLHEAVPVLNPLTSGQQYIKAARCRRIVLCQWSSAKSLCLMGLP